MKNIQKIATKRGKVFVSLKIPEKLEGLRLKAYKKLPRNTWDFCEYLSLEDLQDLLYNPPKGPIEGILREEDLKYIFEDLLRLPNLNASDEEDLVWFLKNYPDIEIKESIISSPKVMSLVFEYRSSFRTESITDYLRFGIYMIGGNPALSHVKKIITIAGAYGEAERINNPEYKSFHSISRDSRRSVLSRIEDWGEKLFSQSVLSEIKEYLPQWRLFVNRYHPKDFKSQFPYTYKLSTIILEKKFDSIETWNEALSKIQHTYGEGIEYAKFLSYRPGEFLKNLDSLLASKNNIFIKTDIIDLIWGLKDVRNSDLFTCMDHFDTLSASVLENNSRIDPAILQMVRDALGIKLRNNIHKTLAGDRFKGKKVFISDILKRVPISGGNYCPKITIDVGDIGKDTVFDITGDGGLVKIENTFAVPNYSPCYHKGSFSSFCDKSFIRSRQGGKLSLTIKGKNFVIPSTVNACLYLDSQDRFIKVIECDPEKHLYYVSGRTLYSYDILKEYAEACGGIITADPEEAQVKLNNPKNILGIC